MSYSAITVSPKSHQAHRLMLIRQKDIKVRGRLAGKKVRYVKVPLLKIRLCERRTNRNLYREAT